MRTPALLHTQKSMPSISRKRARQAGFWQKIIAKRWSYIYLLPFVLLVSVFVVYPMFASLGYTLYQWNGIGDPSVFVGFDNFVRVMHDSIFWEAFSHTFVYAAVLVPIQLTLALLLALVFNNPKLRFSTFYRSVYFLPVVTSPAVIGVIFQLLLANFGDNLSKLLIQMHLTSSPIDWLGDPRFGLGCIIAIGIWNTLGVNMIYFLAALQTIPQELYESARIDGAASFARFVHITVPMLRGIGMVIVIMAILWSLQVFDLVQVLTHGGPYYATEVVNTYIYHQAFGDSNLASMQPNVGFASAASFFYGVILLGFSILQAVLFRFTVARRKSAPLP